MEDCIYKHVGLVYSALLVYISDIHGASGK